MAYPSKSFLLRHKLISFTRDIDVKGFRRLSLMLPKLLLPNIKRSGQHVLTTIHGVKLLIDPVQDRGVEASLYETGTYEKGTIHFMKTQLKSGDTFLDIGANIGLMTCIASQLVGATGKVIAVEANPNTVDILRYNRTLNACDNVEILPIGVSDFSGKAMIYENWSVNRGGASLINQSDQPGVEIDIEKLDDLYDENTALHIVKIDVEGKEPEVIRGAINWFSKQRPIFIIEVSEQREKEKGATPEAVYRIIESLGSYSFFKQKGTKERISKLISILSVSDLPNHDNIYCIPNVD